MRTWLIGLKLSINVTCKSWCFLFGVLQRLQWPFALYEFPMSAVFKIYGHAVGFLECGSGYIHVLAQLIIFDIVETPASYFFGS